MQMLNSTMDQLASKLANQLDTPVINATGLAGSYDMTMACTGRVDVWMAQTMALRTAFPLLSRSPSCDSSRKRQL